MCREAATRLDRVGAAALADRGTINRYRARLAVLETLQAEPVPSVSDWDGVLRLTIARLERENEELRAKLSDRDIGA